jgi:hypothetical protein
MAGAPGDVEGRALGVEYAPAEDAAGEALSLSNMAGAPGAVEGRALGVEDAPAEDAAGE